MAVDVKTLHIGSHVEYDGKRVRICSLKTNMANYDDGKGKPRCFGSNLAYYKHMQPIPITSDLLKELGFEERRREYRYGEPDVWYIDSESAQIEKENNLVVPTIHVSSLGKAGYPDWWVIRVITGDKPMRADSCTVHYLHEAEAFLALHGVELIKE